MNLVKRTAPLPEPPAVVTPAPAPAPPPAPAAPKANPFGSAKAVDTASKLEDIERDRLQKEKERVEKAAADALKAQEEARLAAEARIAAQRVAEEAAVAKAAEEAKARAAAADASAKHDEEDSDESDDDETAGSGSVSGSAEGAREDGFVDVTNAKKEKKADALKKTQEAADLKAKKKAERKAKKEKAVPAPVLNARAAALAEPLPPRQGPPAVATAGDASQAPPPARTPYVPPPPPAINSRISKLIEEEKLEAASRQPPRDFGAPAPGDAGLPVQMNSRFAMAASEDRSLRLPPRDSLPPPPVVNSRFAKAAEEDMANRLPPRDGGGVVAAPLAVNARFANAAAQDKEHMDRRREEREMIGQGRPSAPPPVQNSRFAAAADLDRSERDMRDDRMGGNSRFSSGGFDDRRRDGAGDDGARRPGGAGWGVPRNGAGDSSSADGSAAPSSHKGAGGAGWGVPRNSGPNDGGDSRPAFNAGSNPYNARFNPAPPIAAPPAASKAAPALSSAANILAPTGPALKVSSVIALPGETQEEAEARVAKSKADEEAKVAAAAAAVKEAADKKAAAEVAEAERLQKVAEKKDEICAEFSSGKKLGKELAKWCKEQGKILPTPEVLLYEMLKETQKKNPDTKCEWAKPEKWGTALVALCNFPGADETNVQMQYCWAVQKYCNGIGFPKLGDEAIVVSILKGLYRYDIALMDAQLEYQEDESEAHEEGKGKVLTQGMAWFRWLQEAKEEEDEDDDDTEEEDE